MFFRRALSLAKATRTERANALTCYAVGRHLPAEILKKIADLTLPV